MGRRRTDGWGWGREDYVQSPRTSSDLRGRASYYVGDFVSQYSCVPEPLPDFTREGTGRESVGSLLGPLPLKLGLHLGLELSPVIRMAAVPPGFIRKGFRKKTSEGRVWR